MGVCSEDRWVPWVSFTCGLDFSKPTVLGFFLFESVTGDFL